MSSGDLPSSAPEPWGAHDLRGAGELELGLGPLVLRLQERDGEVWGSHDRLGDGRRPAAPAGAFTRWALAGWDGRVALSPALPDRPVVVEPEQAFWLARGAEVRVYVRVPLWVRVEALGKDRVPLLRLPTSPASDTWWGSMEEGELCYWISTTARRAFDDSLFQPHLAMCPVQLVNRSSDSLPVERIALRVAYLSLYARQGRIWADETRVRYQGEAEGSHLDVGGRSPAEAPDADLLAPPRAKLARGFRALTFARLRSLQGWI